MKLSNLRIIGRYNNPKTGKPVNVHTGKDRQRSIDHLFYYKSGKRIFISDRDFYQTFTKCEVTP